MADPDAGDGLLTVLEYLRKNNIYTAETGQALDIQPLRELAAASQDGGGRMVVYRRDPGSSPVSSAHASSCPAASPEVHHGLRNGHHRSYRWDGNPSSRSDGAWRRNHGCAVRRNPMKVVNNSKALQGVNTSKGVVYLRPGELKDVDFTKEGLEQARRLPFLALRGDKDDKAAADNERDELKKQADELGIEYAKNIPADKLKELVDAKLAE
jgi:major capsid protein